MDISLLVWGKFLLLLFPPLFRHLDICYSPLHKSNKYQIKKNILILLCNVFQKQTFTRHGFSSLIPNPYGAEVHRSWDSLIHPGLSSRSELHLTQELSKFPSLLYCVFRIPSSPGPRILLTIPPPFSLPTT